MRPALPPQALRERLADLLGIGEPVDAPHYRNLRPRRTSAGVYSRCAVETEGPVRAILHKRLVHPERAHALEVEPVVRLYLPHRSAEEEMDREGLAYQEGEPLYALDVRGLGETEQDDGLEFWHPYNVEYMLRGYGLLLGGR